jgi:hypothetical protein
LERTRKFPLGVYRKKENVVNRIEQLTEFVHVKYVASEYKILEFLIPKKFKLIDVPDDSPIFKELIDIDQIWFADEYGEKNYYKITGFLKRSEHNALTEKGQPNPNGFDVIKFSAKDMEVLR